MYKHSYKKFIKWTHYFSKITGTESSTSTNDEIIDDKNTSEEISSHKNSAKVIDHTYDDNGINILNTEEEADFTPIHYINSNNDISMNYEDNFIHKCYAPFLSSNNHEYVYSGSEYD